MDKIIGCLKNRKLQAAAAGLCAVFGIYFAFCLSTSALSHERTVFMLLHLIVVLLAGAAYLLFCRLSAEWESVRKQTVVINGVLMVCAVLFLAANLLNGNADGSAVRNMAGNEGSGAGNFAVYQWISQFLCVVIALAAEAVLLHGKKHHTAPCKKTVDRHGIQGFLVSHIPLFLLCIITMLLVYDPAMSQFKWDGALYYLACRSASVYSVSSMALYGHISQTMGAAVRFLTALMRNDLAAGMMLGNALMLLISICAFYGIVKALLPGRREMVYASAAAVYAWSPFALGMVNYYSLDFYSMCLFPVVIYYTVRRQWILQVVTGLFFCFTKEPAIVIYGALCVGVVAGDLWQNARNAMADKRKRLFCTPQYYAMAAVALLWGVTIMMLGAWSGGNGGFSTDGAYILEKCKVLYILNFNWLCTAFILTGGMILVLSGKIRADKVRMLLPVLTAQTGFTLFSCLFRTVNHARYADISPVCLYLLCCLVLAKITDLLFARMAKMRESVNGRFLSAVYAALALILLISCYRTIDPVSMAVFRTVPIGTETMLTTGTPAPGDSMIYNKQTLWFERALSEALSDVDFGEEAVLFPTVDGNAYHFEGFATAQTLTAGEYRVFEEYWDPAVQCRKPLPFKGSIPLHVTAITDMESLRRLMRESPSARYVYFYSELAGAEMAGEIGRAYRVTEAESVNYRGWQVYRLTFEEWE